MVIILISGKQGSGKTTLAKHLENRYGFEDNRPTGKFHRLRFAQPLYEMHNACRAILSKYNFEAYDYDVKDGKLLQLLGTEWGRNSIHQQIWVLLLNNQLRALPKDSIVTVEDCRFENEFDAFNSVPNVIRVRLEASRQTRMQRAENWRVDENHASETSLDHYAAMGRFDMILDADRLTEKDICQTVFQRIDITLGGFQGSPGMGPM